MREKRYIVTVEFGVGGSRDIGAFEKLGDALRTARAYLSDSRGVWVTDVETGKQLDKRAVASGRTGF